MRHTQYALSSPKKGLHILGLDKFTKNILHFLHKKTHYCLNNSGSSFVETYCVRLIKFLRSETYALRLLSAQAIRLYKGW